MREIYSHDRSVRYMVLDGGGVGEKDGIAGANVRIGSDGSVSYARSMEWVPYPCIRQKDGTRSVKIQWHGVVKHIVVHRLVLLAFGVENQGATQRVVWLDGDRSNCSLANLNWANNMVKPDPPGAMKLCGGCGSTLPLKQFRGNKFKEDGKNDCCKSCVRRKRGPEVDAPEIQPGVLARLIPRYSDLEREDQCCACSDGSIWQRQDDRWMKAPVYFEQGRLMCVVRKKGREVHLHVADVVLRTFRGNRATGWHVVHRDRDPWNCRIDNLRFVPNRKRYE